MGKKICVLEDNTDIRELIEFLLNDAEYVVSGFSSVSTFMKRDPKYFPDLFLLDVSLPDGSGIDVCRLLKAHSHTKDIPVLIMSAHSDKHQIEISCKAQGFVSKPFDIYDLLKKVDTLINFIPG